MLNRLFITLCGLPLLLSAQDTLPPVAEGNVPQTAEAMWAGFDPRAEPLDIEVLKEWEKEGVVLKVVRFRVGVFKGQKAMLAGVYGYPKGANKDKPLPGLIHIHGGGQFADANAVITNAKRGYATLSLAWAGRISSEHYRVGPAEVKLFWEGKTEDPQYRVTTDWGAVDAYHAPSREGKDAFVEVPVYEWSLDAVKSPRNNSWFLCAMGARRGLTFLEQQPEVNAERLGVYGHSMGGKLTVLVASDPRVKAAAPSCGGVSDFANEDPLHAATVGDHANLSQISCPIFFLKPANDFHGRIHDLPAAVSKIQSKEWRITSTPHLNHQDIAASEVATQLWFDEHLKGTFKTPQTPQGTLTLETGTGSPIYTVTPDASRPILGVEIYYTQHLTTPEDLTDIQNAIARHWHYAKPKEDAGKWSARLPLTDGDRPLWVYANVRYALDAPVSGAGYYFRDYTTESFTLSSLIQNVPAEQLIAAGCKAALLPSKRIESFGQDWEKEWFTYKADAWGRTTHRVGAASLWAPEGAGLALRLRSQEDNTLVVGIDSYAAEVVLKGSAEFQTVVLQPSDFKDAAAKPLASFVGIKELRYADAEALRGADDVSRKVGQPWKGAAPEFRSIYWDTNYTWTTDHMQVGVRWQPFIGHPQANAYDSNRPIIARDSSYAQLWVSWQAMEPTERNCDYTKAPSQGFQAIEDAVDACNAHGLKVEFVFFHAPAWATESGEGGGFRPKAGFFPAFVERIATRFKGRVHAYQLSHEANNQSLMIGADMDFLIQEIFIAGSKKIREVYGDEPVIVSTSGTSPCTGCPTMLGLDGLKGGEGMNRFYDYLISHPDLLEAVDGLNQNVSDNMDGFGGADGIHVPSTWGNYDLIRGKLDALDLHHMPVIASESWITWDQGRPTNDVNGDGLINEVDAYDKAVTILGQCIGRGLNTFNLPWSDNSSDWAMGLTKRRDYNGRFKELEPSYVYPALDGAEDIVTQKVSPQGKEENFTLGELGENNVIFTVKDHINPGDANHLHYYIWKWYSQIAGGSDEVVRHAIAGEEGNDIAVFGRGFTGSERYRISSYNRTRDEFTVLIFANGAKGVDSCAVSIPSTIQTGRHYHTDHSKIDFRGEGFKEGESYIAVIETKDLSRADGSDVDLQVITSEVLKVTDGQLSVKIPTLDRFTRVTFRRAPGEEKGGAVGR